MVNTSVLCYGLSTRGYWLHGENSEVHSSSYCDLCVFHTESLYKLCVLGKLEQNFLTYFWMVNTSVLCCGVIICGYWLCCKTSEVFTLHSSSYGDLRVFHTKSLYMCIGEARAKVLKLFPDGKHFCVLLWCK